MVLVRFNHDAEDESKRWRVLYKGVEYLVSNVVFLCPTHTSKDIMTYEDGSQSEKYHICADKYEGVYSKVKENGDKVFVIK